jgi:hypothetical protein
MMFWFLVQLVVAQVATVFDLQAETADGAQALYRRRREDRDVGFLDVGELGVQRGRNGPADMLGSLRSSNGLSGVNTMPLFGLLVKPLIDRPGKATEFPRPVASGRSRTCA